jgi:hypothetical protein
MSALTPYDWQNDDINRLLDHDATGFVVAETGAGSTAPRRARTP